MNIKSLLARPFAAYISNSIRRDGENALNDQSKIFQQLLKAGSTTLFGKDHHFTEISNPAEFSQAVPIREYEQIRPYIEMIQEGKQNVLWRGKPIYFAKTSGTTSGIKYIPITKDSVSHHINAARNALLCFIAETGNNEFTNGKMIFLSGSPELGRMGGIATGRLSGIVNHHVPAYLRRNQLPSYETNCIEDWESKLDAIVQETAQQDMTLISGIPPWMQMYFDRLQEKTGKSAAALFPHLSVIVHGGVNFAPYRDRLFKTIGKEIATIETYPASEGFIAFQDSQQEEGLWLNTNSGIFFEFIPAAEIFSDRPTRLTLNEVKLGEQYVLIINSNAGLWGYNIGDTVKFVSLKPYRIVVTGRVKHFISAFGEHVIGEEVEYSLLRAAEQQGLRITEFTVAPYIESGKGKSYHEWFIEFEQQPEHLDTLAVQVDRFLQEKNIYYKDLIQGHILLPLRIRPVQKNGFIEYMKSQGKLGGQNKVPRLSNDRKIVSGLEKFVLR